MSQEPKFRFFLIPGSKDAPWDPEIHGTEIDATEEDLGESAEVFWVPGTYRYVFGASGSCYTFGVPEPLSATYPSMDVLKGIHAFLSVAHDE